MCFVILLSYVILKGTLIKAIASKKNWAFSYFEMTKYTESISHVDNSHERLYMRSAS